jgi:LPXTG-site transpeptidase (sortase) family protein
MRWLERLLVLIGLGAFGILGVDVVRAAMDSAAAQRVLSGPRTADATPGLSPSSGSEAIGRAAVPAVGIDDRGEADAGLPPATASPRVLVGELQIPRIDLSTLVFAVRDPASLRHAAGHLGETALPWDAGNTAIAGHRDSAFRRLRAARPGDEIRFVTPHGTFRYEVTRAFIVSPEDVWVLKDDAAALTLITCFPFRWVGTAPERWIVHAKRLQP